MAIPRALMEELVERSEYEEIVIREILNALAEAAADAVEAGEDFTVPGIVKIQYSYTPAKAKGERWKKGDEVVGFGGVSEVKETDSVPVKAKIVLKPYLAGDVLKLKPGTKPEAQSAFLKSKAGRRVVSRKG